MHGLYFFRLKGMQRYMKVECRDSSIAEPGEGGCKTQSRWSLASRIAFRFACVYFPLYSLYQSIHYFPITPIPQLFEKYKLLLRMIVAWVGQHLLHLPPGIPVVISMPNSSTDTTYHYVLVLCYLMFAALVTVIWSFLDRKRRNYDRLQPWFMLYLRLTLATVLIHYGASKVFGLQFPPPTLARLLQTYGDSSPMGLLWTFMGASRIYSAFGGVMEVLSGALLLIPPLTTLGALVCLGVTSNVFMLNLGYDVTVKLLSMHLVLMSLVLLVPDLNRLMNVFVLSRAVEAPQPRRLFSNEKMNKAALILQVVFCVILPVFSFQVHENDARQLIVHRLGPPLYGAWSIDELRVGGKIRPPLLTDTLCWHRIMFQNDNAMTVQLIGNGLLRFGMHLDLPRRFFRITRAEDLNWSASFSYEDPQPNQLILTGEMNGHQIAATMHRINESEFLLTTRGFHWINEYPVQR